MITALTETDVLDKLLYVDGTVDKHKLSSFREGIILMRTKTDHTAVSAIKANQICDYIRNGKKCQRKIKYCN